MLRRTVVALLAGLIALPVVALVSAPKAHATSPGGNGKIAFTSNLAGRTEVYTANTDGTGVTELTDSAGAADPSWSPDGSSLAYGGGPDPAGGYPIGPPRGGPA